MTIAFMLTGELRRSRRISELEAQSAQRVPKLEAGTRCKDNHHACESSVVSNQAVDMPSRAEIPEKSKLELLLNILQRKDTHEFFAKPVVREEVEHYYDVVKEPMDFGTIARKLNEGSYSTLRDFEHDVFLVSNNAMLFNASNTVYYRQARALKELAQKLFNALKTDPDNFDTEISMLRLGPGRRPKAGVQSLNNSSSNKKTGIETVSKGNRCKRRSEYREEQRRTYRPWTSFLNEKESMVSMVYNVPKALKLDEKTSIGYRERLMRFAEDLGPTAQMVARRKAAEASKIIGADSNHQHHVLSPIPTAGSSALKAITTTPLKLFENSVESQTFFDKPSGIQTGGFNAKMATTMDSYFLGKRVREIQYLGDKVGPSHSGNLEQADLASNWFKQSKREPQPSLDDWLMQKSWLSEMNLSSQAGPSWQQGFTSDGGLYQIPGIADEANPSYKGNLVKGGQLSHSFKPVNLGSQPMLDGCFQQQSKSFQVDSLGQAGMSRMLQQQSWATTPYSGQHAVSTSNAGKFERWQPPGQAELSIEVPPQHCPQQPLSDIDSLLQWLLEH